MAAPAQNGPVTASGPAKATEAQLIAAFDNSIWYLLDLWQPLSIAVENGWGGGNSADKRDWFAGAVSEFLNQPQYINPPPGTVLTFADMQEDLEVFLLQIMQDEFDCNIEDESEVEVANSILKVRKAMTESLSTAAADEVDEDGFTKVPSKKKR
ncbi:Pre-rRNA-processing protein TSR2 [Pseudocercospora fuligena]|uniref:Pre-rRNA-processing protein TSR2 n=1 Tax=Pseudocercospora fuligena TaxID=685502 RepID=A0A8H6R4F4_9PEZI|nr:Pre-rRNA-processing protein TSR2 [Pseudocercospora fuligena]